MSFGKAVGMYGTLMCLAYICLFLTNAVDSFFGALWLILLIGISLLLCTKRGELRRKYGIAGNACEDCCCYFCCTCCAITQEARHVDFVTKQHGAC